jgi:hypothetical protein
MNERTNEQTNEVTNDGGLFYSETSIHVTREKRTSLLKGNIPSYTDRYKLKRIF